MLEYWRKNKLKAPVIIMTARDELQDRVTGLDTGADDYVVKPFAMAELLARIRAVTRRRAGADPDGTITYGDLTLIPNNHDGTITYGDLTLIPNNHEVRVREVGGERSLILTSREFALFEALMSRPGAVLSREALEGRIYGWDEEVDSNAIEYLLYALRRKIGSEFIKNIRGVGWKINKITKSEEGAAAAEAK